jgi:anthranilate synthase component 2
VISPGPCSPAEAGISVEAIRYFAGKLPILGVCLGHQSIGAAFGGKIIRAQQLMHGKTSEITTTREGVFAGCRRRSRSTATTRWRSSARPARPS